MDTDFEIWRILFAVGVLLTAIGVGVLGAILAIVGVYYLARAYGREDAFRPLLIGFVIVIIESIVGIYLLLFGGMLAVTGIATALNGGLLVFLVSLIPLGIWWVLNIVAAYFIRSGLQALSEASGERKLAEGARWIWIGALTAIVLVGLIFRLIGYIFVALGAFDMKKPAPSPAQQGPSSG